MGHGRRNDHGGSNRDASTWVLEHVLSGVQKATHLYMLSRVVFYNLCVVNYCDLPPAHVSNFFPSSVHFP